MIHNVHVHVYEHSLIVQYLLHSCCQFICVLLTAAVGLLCYCCSLLLLPSVGLQCCMGLTNMDTRGTVTFVMINGVLRFQELKYSLGMQLMPALSGCLYMLFRF